MLTDPNEFAVCDLIRFLAEGRTFEIETKGRGTFRGRITWAFADGDVLEVTGQKDYICTSDITDIREVK